MAFDLNPVAVTAAPLLRAIKAGGWTTKTELADIAGRARNHMARDLGVLASAGLINPEPPTLTDDGEAQLAALDRAANPDAGGGLTALHADLEPHPLNPRKDFESDAAEEGLNELRESILLRQLMQPIVVRPRPDQPGKWWIVDGERRWRAIGQAISDADWDDDRPIPIVPRAVDDREHLLLSLTANLQRADMAAIEEAVAFNAAVHDFGITTEQLADELGKSRRYVQQRIALLKLSADDQDRMRLPKDHPEHLSFKAARSLSQTPRAPGEPDRPLPHEEFSQMVAAQPHLTPAVASEPGSPPTDQEPPSFGKSLTDREALLLVEICDKSERDPDADLGSEGYTRVQNVPVTGAAASLVAKNVIGFRQRGANVFVTPRLHSTGAKAWLEEIGFYQHRADVLLEFRARVSNIDRATSLAEAGTYDTAWLNLTGDPMLDGGSGMAFGPRDAMAQYAADRRAGLEPDPEAQQPELIEASEEEKAAREAAEARRRQQLLDDGAVDQFAAQLKAKLAEGRGKGRGGWNLPEDREGGCSVAFLADELVRHVPKGDPLDIAAFAMFLSVRAGVMGAGQAIRQAVERSAEPT